MVDGLIIVIGMVFGIGGIIALIFLFSVGFKQWNETPPDSAETLPEEKNKVGELKGKDFAIGLGIFILLMIIMSAC